MFPVRDDVPSRTYPYATLGLIILNTVIFILQFAHHISNPSGAASAVASFGLVPARVAEGRLWPFFTSMFMHGGWFHLIGNMWYLWIFGDNVEDRLGHAKFVVFYILCGLLGNLGHFLSSPGSAVPAIGASGAIAGVLGAYIISYPRARILVVIPLFVFLHLMSVPAVVVLGFWFIIQLVSGAVSLSHSGGYGVVAWWAHIGGFVAGMALIKVMRPRPRIFYRR